MIRTAVYIALSGSVLTAALLFLFEQRKPHSCWVAAIFIVLYAVLAATMSIIFLRRFLVRQFDSIIKKRLMELNNDKASEIDRLKEMERYRKEFVGNVSHELKTPIFNIQGYILTLLDGGMDDPAVNRLYLERSEKSINRMIHIVEDLESIARLESGELQLDLESFDMMKLVDEVFEMEERTAKEARISLEAEKKPVWVYADRKRILEVMNNLIANSIHYGRKNGTTSVAFTEQDKMWRISVTDDGIGIAEKDCKRIFERFYRCDKSRSREQGGTGLGLAIVKHIVEAHGQTVTVQSASGQGSTFLFALPKNR